MIEIKIVMDRQNYQSDKEVLLRSSEIFPLYGKWGSETKVKWVWVEWSSVNFRKEMQLQTFPAAIVDLSFGFIAFLK